MLPKNKIYGQDKIKGLKPVSSRSKKPKLPQLNPGVKAQLQNMISKTMQDNVKVDPQGGLKFSFDYDSKESKQSVVKLLLNDSIQKVLNQSENILSSFDKTAQLVESNDSRVSPNFQNFDNHEAELEQILNDQIDISINDIQISAQNYQINNTPGQNLYKTMTLGFES